MFRDYMTDRNEGNFVMPSKSKGKENASKFDFNYKATKWANVPLAGDDIPEIIDRAKNQEENIGDLLTIFSGGCNISIKHRPDGSTVSVTAIFSAGLHASHPVGLSGFAPDVATAVSTLLYKYFVVAGGDLSGYISDGESRIG